MFIGLVINLAWTIAVVIGVNFQIENPDCKEEVDMIQGNRRAVKGIAIANLVLFVALVVLSNF